MKHDFVFVTWNLKFIGGRHDGVTVTGLHADVIVEGYKRTDEVIDGFVIYRPE